LKLGILLGVDVWQVVPCRNQSANRKNSRIGKSAISRKQPLLFSSKQWESSSLGRATRRSVILAQVGVDNVILKAKLGTMKNIHRWGFVFIVIGIALWMSGVSPQLGSILFVIGLVGLVIAWVTKS
jgi:small-conductance mechanosensitive channel